jgi:hypothetical protein
MKFVLFRIEISTIKLSSCYNNSEEALFPMDIVASGNCDTTISTYSKAV